MQDFSCVPAKHSLSPLMILHSDSFFNPILACECIFMNTHNYGKLILCNPLYCARLFIQTLSLVWFGIPNTAGFVVWLSESSSSPAANTQITAAAAGTQQHKELDSRL